MGRVELLLTIFQADREENPSDPAASFRDARETLPSGFLSYTSLREIKKQRDGQRERERERE